jgi:hypothetical protein
LSRGFSKEFSRKLLVGPREKLNLKTRKVLSGGTPSHQYGYYEIRTQQSTGKRRSYFKILVNLDEHESRISDTKIDTIDTTSREVDTINSREKSAYLSLREGDVDGDHHQGQDDGIASILPANGHFLCSLTPRSDTKSCRKAQFLSVLTVVLAPSTPMQRARPATSTLRPRQKYAGSYVKHSRTGMKGLRLGMAK